MTSNLLCCVILHQLCTYRLLTKNVNPSNNFYIVCFSSIYQGSITLINIHRFYRSSTNISPQSFTLKKISHHITPIQIILFIQLHTHRMKRIISFSSHNQQTKKIITQKKKRKTKYHIAETKENEIPYCRNKGKQNTNWIRERCVWD